MPRSDWDGVYNTRGRRGRRRTSAYEERMLERQEAREAGRSGVSHLADILITGAVAISGMVAQPPVDTVLQAGDAYDHSRRDTEERDLGEETRHQGDRHGWSGRQ